MKEKSNDDLNKVRQLIELPMSLTESISSFSFSGHLYAALSYLAKGQEIDDVYSIMQSRWNSSRGDPKIEEQVFADGERNANSALVSTHLVLSYSDSSAKFSFYSNKESQCAIDTIKFVVLLREAQKRCPILCDWDIEPAEIAELSDLKSIAQGKQFVDHPVRTYIIDKSGFYRHWRRAIEEAAHLVFGKAVPPEVFNSELFWQHLQS
jgi:hypothetical protein